MLKCLWAVALAVANTKDEPEEHESDEENEDTSEPDRTNEDDLLESIALVKEGNSLDGAENAKLWGAIPGQAARA